jgi:TP901 family phage tail tape measure protein
MAMNLDALLRIKADVQGENNIRKLGNSMQGVTGQVKNLQNAVSGLSASFQALGTAFVVGDAARRYFKGFDEAQKASAAVRTLGVDSKDLEGQLLGVSNRLGGLYSQTQLLTAAYDVASAGFSNAADNAKILEAAAKGATGGLSDINTVGNAATSVLNAYGLSADKAAKLIDGFIQTQNDGKIVVDQYAKQIGNIAPTAAAAGISIEELNAAISTVTATGVPVEATFTGLRQAIVSILKPSSEAQKLAASLGIDFNEAALRSKGFAGVLTEVAAKTKGSTTALTTLFGSVEAVSALLPITNDGLTKYNENLEKQARSSGVAEDATRELGGTVSSEVTKMVNQIGNLTRSLDTVLGPALGGIVKLINVVIAEATRGINVLGQLFSMNQNTTILRDALQAGDLRGSAAGRVIPGVDELIGQQRRQALQRQAGAGTGFLGMGFNAQQFGELLKQQPEIKRLLGGQQQTRPGRPAAQLDPALQALLEGGGEKSGETKAKKGLTDAEREAKRLADELARSLELGDQMGVQFSRQILLLNEASDIEKQRLQIGFDYEDRAKQINELKNEEQRINLTSLNDEIRRVELINLQTELIKQQVEEARNLSEAMIDAASFGVQPDFALDLAMALQDARTKLQELVSPLNLVRGTAESMGRAFGDSFRGLISGSMSAKEALASFFQATADAFMDMAAQIITQLITITILESLSKIFSSASGLSGAGALGSSGVPNIQGAMTPGAPLGLGSIGTPGSAAAFSGFGVGFRANGGSVMGNMPYIVGERGPELFVPGVSGSVLSNADTRAALAQQATNRQGNDTRAMLNQQKPIDVKYESTVINSVEYVTAEQHQKGMAQAAERGRALALNAMQYSVKTRKLVGMA